MNILINGSNRENNCYHILKDLMTEQDEIISLSHKDIKYCLGCDTCSNKLDKYCILNDYMSQSIYQKLRNADKIIIASPLYMSGITGLLKNVIDRLNPFYHHGYFEGKELYLILTGQGTYEENEEEIKDIIKYFNGISEWMNFKFIFLKYFTSGSPREIDDVRQVEANYLEEITNIKNKLENGESYGIKNET